jgi:hypothetical protein
MFKGGLKIRGNWTLTPRQSSNFSHPLLKKNDQRMIRIEKRMNSAGAVLKSHQLVVANAHIDTFYRRRWMIKKNKRLAMFVKKIWVVLQELYVLGVRVKDVDVFV